MKRILLLLTAFLYICSLNASSSEPEKTDYGIRTAINGVNIEIQFYRPDIVRVIKYPSGQGFNKNSLTVVTGPADPGLSVSTSGGYINLKSQSLTLKIDTLTGRIVFLSPQGNILLSEKDYGIQFTPVQYDDLQTSIVRQAFMLDPDEAIYGLGQQQQGRMIQRHQRILLKQDNTSSSIPFIQSVKGYGLFWDNYSRTTFTDNYQETSFESEAGHAADYYFMYGGNADGVINAMHHLTGHVPMLPYWSYGYWQCRERYKSQDEIVGVVRKYREAGVPLDGIIQDWQYWNTDHAYWNSMTFGNPEFPDPEKMTDDIHNLNAHIVISVWPSFGPETKQYAELEDKGMLYDFFSWPTDPQVKIYDAFNPEARDIYWDYLNKGLFSTGIDGWWLDATEPEHNRQKEEDFANKTYLGQFREVLNAYPLMSVKGVYEHQRQVTSDKRVFILTRSAFAGQQRYGANTWSGDIHADWYVLKNQISAGLNFSLCGIPFWNSDIGAFTTYTNYPDGANDPAYRELYVRWLQFGAFCPMMRSHGTNTPREIYQFGEKGQWAYDAIEKSINLRYRLLPYIYSTSYDITANSSSMTRALMMDYPDDREALDINDQYMFGKAILVCPVTEAMYTEKSNEKPDFSHNGTLGLYLPSGNSWTDFWTGMIYEGGRSIEREVPIDIIPLFVKAGSIIPVGPEVQYASEKKDPLEIRIYPGADGKFVLYDDERDNYNYEKGMFSTTEFNWDDSSRTLTIGERKGSYPGMMKKRTFNIVVVDGDRGAGIELTVRPDRSVKYAGKEMKIRL